MAALCWALPAALAFASAYRAADHLDRQTLRAIGAGAFFATCIALALTWR